MAISELQRLAKRVGFAPVPVSPPRRPGRPLGARDRQQRARLSAQASWELAIEMMRERWGSPGDYGRERYEELAEEASPNWSDVSSERYGKQSRPSTEAQAKADLVLEVMENEKQRLIKGMRSAGLRRYRKGPKPAPMLVRRRKA